MQIPSFSLKNSGIRTKLILAYIILITVPMFVTGVRYYVSTRDMIYETTQRNVHEIVKKNNEMIDSKLKEIKENVWELMSDSEFIEKSSSVELNNNYKIVSMDIELTKILNKYFLSSQDISSVQLITSYHAFGYSSTMGFNRNYIPIESFLNSELYGNAVKAKGKLEWFPTYDFAQMFNQTGANGINAGYEHMFSAVQQIKTANIRFRDMKGTGVNVENPILLVNLDEKFFHKFFDSSITLKDSYFFIVTKEGRLISHMNKDKIGKTEAFPWLEQVSSEGSGQAVVKIDGVKTLICYDTSNETGWISVIAIKYDSLLSDIISEIKTNSVYLIIVLTIIPILISYFVWGMITKPITRLTKAIKITGEGDFSIKVPETGSVEISELIHRFNNMNDRIQKLIQENYEIKIKEKEAEINALNLQLDPHFMYNTLNIVNLKLIQNGHDEISEMIMSLSAMLKFTARNKSTLVPLEQELDYLKGYIYIMSKRFDGRFSVEYDMDLELYEYNVPKFLFQPFVENSLIHGFESTKEGGLLKISGRIDGNKRVFTIEDNGNGMSEERLQQVLNDGSDSVGINNVRKRIKIIYGAEYEIDIKSEISKGTRVTIHLPNC